VACAPLLVARALSRREAGMTQRSDFTKPISDLAELFPGLFPLAKSFAWVAAVILLLALASLKTGVLDAAAIDAIGKIAASLVLFAGGIWALVTYANNKKLEFQKYFNERQVEVALLTASTVGNLVEADDNGWKESKARFWELYWGRLVLFEDKGVVEKMVELGRKLRETPFENREYLQDEVYAVSLELRRFLAEKNTNDWRISFETLPNQSLRAK
jgi:hypothetical protein